MGKLNQNDFEPFCTIIQDMLNLFDDVITFENNKLDAITANDIITLDNYLHDEQAYLMKMRGLESKREKLLNQLGVPGLTFKEIICEFDSPEKETLHSFYDELSLKTSELQESISTTKRYIDLNLHSVTTLLERIEGNITTYGKGGEKEDSSAQPQRFTPTKA